MDFLKMLADNFWFMLFIIIIVSVVGGLVLEAYKASIKSRQKMLELRNEELRLRLMMEQQKKEQRTGASAADVTLPKEASWQEQAQTSYEMGYQQQQL